MSFKYKKFFSSFVKGLFPVLLSMPGMGVAASSRPEAPSASLYVPTGSLAAYSGVGAAAPGDYSSVDANPAVLSALKRQYTVFGDTAWQTYDNLVGVGVFDNSTTEVSTLVRGGESVPSGNDTRDRRFTLGLSYRVPKTHLSFGLSINYEQLTLTNLTTFNSDAYYAGTGFLYEYFLPGGRPLFVGAGINRMFDRFAPLSYDVGISAPFFDGFYSVALDTLSSNLSGLQKVAGSLTVAANQFLDLKGSYGYAMKDKRNVWAAGIFFHAPVLQLFYTIANSDVSSDTAFRQTAGCAFNFVL